MRRLLLLAALLAAAPAAAAPPPAPRATVMLRVTVPLDGAADRPAWQPTRPSRAFTGSEVAKNLSEGWWGIGILAVGGAVWLYDKNRH